MAILTQHRIKVGLQSLIYLALVFFLLREIDETSTIEECSGFDAPARALERSDYDLLIRYSTWEEPSNRKVVLVILDSNIEPDDVITNFCAQREFTGRLIDRLNELNVSVISLDKDYQASRCPNDDQGTRSLQDAVRHSRAIITRGISSVIIPRTATKKEKSCLLVRAGSDLPLDVPENRAGLLRLDANTKLAPLSWPVHLIDEKKNSDTVVDLPTLSFVTAEAAEPSAVRTAVLKRALRERHQPYSTRTAIPTFSAAQILCGKNYTKTTDNWRTCKSADQWTELNNAIVMFGDHIGDGDRHPDAHNPNGIYGVDLQANYLAAVLDKRYYTTLSPSFDISVIGCALFVLHICFHFFKPLWRTLLIAVGVWVVVVLISLPIVSYTGYLFTVWMHGLTLTTIAVTALHHWSTTGE